MSSRESGPITKLSKRVKTLGALTLAPIGGWLAYSRFGVNHQVPLPAAIEAKQMNFTATRAGRLNYYVANQAQGRPLVLIHSINAAPSAMEMKPLFAHYRTQRPVYALELPGFGFSERGPRDYSPELYADTIVDFLTHEVGEAADVIVLSLSCEFAARAALANPALFNSLVFISPTGFGFRARAKANGQSGSDDAAQRAAFERLYQVATVSLWSQALFDLLTVRPSIRYFLGQSFAGAPTETMIEYAYNTSHQPGARYAPFAFLGGKLFTWGIDKTIYAQLTTPTLVLYDLDPNINFDRMPELLSKNKHWRAVRITPTRGLPHWEKLAETTAAIDEFWAAPPQN